MPRFGDLEAAIMDRIWSAEGRVSVRDILEDLQQDRSIAYTTVQTVMDILHRKGWLHREKDGRAYRYWPTGSREDYTARLMGEALETSSDRDAALARFVGQMDVAEVHALRKAIDDARDRPTR